MEACEIGIQHGEHMVADDVVEQDVVEVGDYVDAVEFGGKDVEVEAVDWGVDGELVEKDLVGEEVAG